MANCEACGEENRSEARFCRFCGEPMNELEDAASNELVEGVPELTSNDQEDIESSETFSDQGDEPLVPESKTGGDIDEVVADNQVEEQQIIGEEETETPGETEEIVLTLEDFLVDLPEENNFDAEPDEVDEVNGEQLDIDQDEQKPEDEMALEDDDIDISDYFSDADPGIAIAEQLALDEPQFEDPIEVEGDETDVLIEDDVEAEANEITDATASEEPDVELEEEQVAAGQDGELIVDKLLVEEDDSELEEIEPLFDSVLAPDDELDASSLEAESLDEDESLSGESEDDSEDVPAGTETIDEPQMMEAHEDVLPEGTVLQGRYRILSIASRETESVLYEAEDMKRCWSCQAVQLNPEPRFCEECGAELERWLRVLLRASRTVTAGQLPDQEGSWFLEDDIVFLVALPAVEADVDTSPIDIHLAVGYRTDTGMERIVNEDSMLVLQMAGLCESCNDPLLAFFAVADGMGGHDAGEVASRVAVHSLAASVMERIFTPAISGNSLQEDTLAQELEEIVVAANRAILDLRTQALGESNMGCTLTAALVYECFVVVANVGDSRTYLMRAGELSQVTRDHSMVARLIEQGVMEPDAIYTHEQKGVIYRSLGDRPDLEVETFVLELEAGDRLLLCSDGLWDMVRDPYIEETLLQYFDPMQASEQLVAQANLAGGEDNISVILVDVKS